MQSIRHFGIVLLTVVFLAAGSIAVAEEQGADVSKLQGTVQNDLIKEYLSRGTYICPPAPSLKMIADVAEYCYTNVPKWNPMNVCSYHLQEAGATPTQELAYALCTATAILDAVRDSGQIAPERFAAVVGRISFFVNAGVRFVEEMCKMRAFVELWAELLVVVAAVRANGGEAWRYPLTVRFLR